MIDDRLWIIVDKQFKPEAWVDIICFIIYNYFIDGLFQQFTPAHFFFKYEMVRQMISKIHMSSTAEKIVTKKYITVISLILLLFLSGCSQGKNNSTGSNAGNDMENIRKVGVILGWESDIMLTYDNSVNPVRYDELSDLFLALRYNKIDAVSLDESSIKRFENSFTGVKRIEPETGVSGYVALFSPKNKDLMDDYNAFLTEYMSTPEYETFKRTKASFNGFDYPEFDTAANGTGRSIKVAYMAGAYPRAFEDTETGNTMGFEFEIMLKWAHERDYNLEFIPSSYTDIINGLRVGRYDVAAGYFSDLYKEDYIRSGLNISKPHDFEKIYMLVRTGDKITVSKDVDDLF